MKQLLCFLTMLFTVPALAILDIDRSIRLPGFKCEGQTNGEKINLEVFHYFTYPMNKKHESKYTGHRIWAGWGNPRSNGDDTAQPAVLLGTENTGGELHGIWEMGKKETFQVRLSKIEGTKAVAQFRKFNETEWKELSCTLMKDGVFMPKAREVLTAEQIQNYRTCFNLTQEECDKTPGIKEPPAHNTKSLPLPEKPAKKTTH
jgi:hypothetical protein